MPAASRPHETAHPAAVSETPPERKPDRFTILVVDDEAHITPVVALKLTNAGYRVVSYDQRNHGVSEVGDLEHCTIDQLGKDLRAVVDATTPVPQAVAVELGSEGLGAPAPDAPR